MCRVAGLFLSTVAAMGCAAAEPVQPADLNGRWVLEAIDGRPVAANVEMYFEIQGSALTGYDGCNNFGGSLDNPSMLRMTQRACSSEQIPFPLDLTDPRAQLALGKLQGDVLELPMAGSGTATFRRREKASAIPKSSRLVQ